VQCDVCPRHCRLHEGQRGLCFVRGRDRNVPIPFGPYLAAAGWIAMMWGPQIVGGYLSLAGLYR